MQTANPPAQSVQTIVQPVQTVTLSVSDLEKKFASQIRDVLIRTSLILALAWLCYRVFSPFLTLTVWAVILAVTLYPFHRMIAGWLNGREARDRGGSDSATWDCRSGRPNRCADELAWRYRP